MCICLKTYLCSHYSAYFHHQILIKKQHREYIFTKSPYLLLLEIVHDFELSPKEQRAHHM